MLLVGRPICFLLSCLVLRAPGAAVLGTERLAGQVTDLRLPQWSDADADRSSPAGADADRSSPLGSAERRLTLKRMVHAQVMKTQDVESAREQAKWSGPISDISNMTNRTLKIASSSDVPAELEDNVAEIKSTLVPGWRPPMRELAKCLLAFVLASIWFSIYFRLLYCSDRRLSVLQLEPLTPAMQDDSLVNDPDVFFLFHNPDCKREDDDEEILICDLEQDFLFGDSHVQWRMLEEPMDEESTRELRTWLPNLIEVIRAAPSDKLTKGSVREALLKDVIHCLQKMHFDIHGYKSTDGQIVFVGAKLRDQACEHYMIRDNLHLPLKPSVVKDVLNVLQPPEEAASAPAHIRFSHGTAQRLNLGVHELYETGHASNVESQYFLCSADRIRIVYKELMTRFNLAIAEDAGFMVGWFPLHHKSRVHELECAWANFGKLCDLSFNQPVETLKTYFGAELTLVFLWIGTYCKALLGLMPLALFRIAAVKVFSWNLGMSQVAYALVLVFWALLAARLWEREENYFFNAWCLYYNVARVPRPQFRGTLQPSQLDEKVKTLKAGIFGPLIRQIISSFVVGLFCFIVVACTLYSEKLFPLNQRKGTAFSTILALQIKFFEIFYSQVSKILLDFENHKYPEEYCGSYFWKRFLFQSVNNYVPFVHIIFMQALDPEQCPTWSSNPSGDGCFILLRAQLTQTLIQLTAMRIFFLGVSVAKVKVGMAWIYGKLKGKDVVLSPAERQATYEEFNELSQMDTLLQLVASLGHVCLFGAVAPVAVPLCFIEFAVELRATAIELTAYKKRPLPAETFALGPCRNAMGFLVSMSILLTSILLVMHGQWFKDAPTISKLSGCLFFICLAYAARGVLRLAFDREDPATRLMEARRQYVKSKLYDKEKELSQAGIKFSIARSGEFGDKGAQAVKRGEWALLPEIH